MGHECSEGVRWTLLLLAHSPVPGARQQWGQLACCSSSSEAPPTKIAMAPEVPAEDGRLPRWAEQYFYIS